MQLLCPPFWRMMVAIQQASFIHYWQLQVLCGASERAADYKNCNCLSLPIQRSFLLKERRASNTGTTIQPAWFQECTIIPYCFQRIFIRSAGISHQCMYVHLKHQVNTVKKCIEHRRNGSWIAHRKTLCGPVEWRSKFEKWNRKRAIITFTIPVDYS